MSLRAVFLTILTTLACYNEGARILGIVPTPSYSHQIAFQPLWKELSLRGHEVTVITTNPIKDESLTNLTEIDVSVTYSVWDKYLPLISNERNPVTFMRMLKDIAHDMLEMQFQIDAVQNLIHNRTENFDLVVIEFAYFAYFAFAERFNAPCISVSSMEAPVGFHMLLSDPMHPVLNPDINLPIFGKLTFLERLISAGYHVFSYFFVSDLLREQQSLVEKYFGDNYRSLYDVWNKNVSLFFINTNWILQDSVRPMAPAVINIGGGTHISQSTKPLPKDLKNYLDKASNGFIYFSLGTNVESKNLPQELLEVLTETFSELSYRIVWKFENETLPGKPDNLMISKWFPQQEILKHPNIKLFITQGGLQSVEEAIFNNVPMLGMPFFGDQHKNIKRIVKQGLGLSFDYQNFDKSTFIKAIVEVAENSKYRQNIKKLKELAQDEPMTGLQRAIWWTEYVIRHKGATHLRNPALDLPFYQYYLLDVIGLSIVVIAICFYLFVVTLKIIFKITKCIVRLKPKHKID